MPDYSSIAKRQSQLIRKALQGSVFIAPYTAPPITAMTTGANQDINPLPTGYVDVGWIDKKNAVTWSQKVTTTEVMAWGDVYASRRDITKIDSQLKFNMLETNKQSLQLYNGVDLTSTTLLPLTRELQIAQPSRPQPIPYRVFGLFQDGVGSNTTYVGRFYPRAFVTDVNDQKWDDEADALMWDIGMTAQVDSVLGYPCLTMFGGPGWVSQLVAGGWSTNPGGS